MTEQPIMSPERMEQARRYRTIGYRLLLANLAISLVYLVALVLGLSAATWQVLPHVLAYLPALFVIHFLLLLPVDYIQYRASVRYGLSVQSPGAWLADQGKSFLVSVVLNGLLGLGLLWSWRLAPQTWHLWAAAGAVLFNILLSYVAPVLIMPMFHKYTPLEEGELKERLLNLSRRAGVLVRGVYVSDASKKVTALNAALTGVGGTRRIILFDTLIQSCTPDEVEVVLAHEMGHHVYNHVTKVTLAYSAFLAAVLLTAGYLLEPLSLALGLGGLEPPALPLVMLLTVSAGAVLMPALMAYLRQAERHCDTFALKMTGNPRAFIESFRRIADRNLADLSPPAWYYFFFTTHPPVPERVAMAERWQPEA